MRVRYCNGRSNESTLDTSVERDGWEIRDTRRVLDGGNWTGGLERNRLKRWEHFFYWWNGRNGYSVEHDLRP
jgi:hypothetical protein